MAKSRASSDYISPYDRLSWSDREVEHLLATGIHRRELVSYFGAVEYRELPRGQIQVEPKEEARKRGVQSPDRAEAEVMAFCRIVPREQHMVFAGQYQISPI